MSGEALYRQIGARAWAARVRGESIETITESLATDGLTSRDVMEALTTYAQSRVLDTPEVRTHLSEARLRALWYACGPGIEVGDSKVLAIALRVWELLSAQDVAESEPELDAELLALLAGSGE